MAIENLDIIRHSKDLRAQFNSYDLLEEAIIQRDRKSYLIFSGGCPIASDSEKTVIIDQTDSHTIVFGSTGSKKTRTVVMPTIKILGVAGESMIINDTKGELYHRMESELSQRGYQVLVLNFRNAARGNCWNPLAIPYQWYLEDNIDKATELVNDIANNLMANELKGNLDPYWNYSAADLFFGLTLLLFKYCKEHNRPKESVNISNLLLLRRTLFSERSYKSILWDYAKQDELIAASLSGTIVAAPGTTRASILSVFDQHMRVFVIQPTLMNMLSTMDFNIGDIAENKTALFIITPDEKSSYHKLVSLFIKQSYEYLIYKAMQNINGKVSLRVNFILDEFGSLPAVSDMNAMIAAARSRDIRFLLVTQSKHQLLQHYGDDAQTIISNCNNWIYLTSREIELLQEISQLCGNNERNRPNLSVFELQHFDKTNGEALLLCARMKPHKIFLPDINEYYPAKQFVAAKEVPLRTAIRIVKLDFELSEEIKQVLKDDDDDDDLF